MRAEMDGGNPTGAVCRLLNPFGITIGLKNATVMWTEHGAHEILTYEPNPPASGQHIRRLTYWTEMSPTGITVLRNGKIFWGTYGGRGSSLHRGDLRRAILNISDVYVGSPVSHVTVATVNVPNITRSNPCEEKGCKGVCALTPTSASCLG